MKSNYLPTDYQSFIHTSRYARWLEEEGRRESWSETVDRYINNVVSNKIDENTKDDLMFSILVVFNRLIKTIKLIADRRKN